MNSYKTRMLAGTIIIGLAFMVSMLVFFVWGRFDLNWISHLTSSITIFLVISAFPLIAMLDIHYTRRRIVKNES